MTETICGERELGSETQKPSLGGLLRFGKGKPCGDLLSHGSSALSLARSRFTVLFGMGRGGSETLWPQGEGFGSWERRICARSGSRIGRCVG